ncbi:MAG: ABC transporter substrate-binding protein, partial [Thermoproteota archaeon]
QRIASIIPQSKSRTNASGVYFEVWNDPYMTVNSRTWIGDLITLAGGINVFGKEPSEWPIIQSEEVVERNPDIIFFPVIPDVPRFWGSFEAVKRRPGWANIDAVRNERLYEVPRDLISRPGPRLVEALELMANVIHSSS